MRYIAQRKGDGVDAGSHIDRPTCNHADFEAAMSASMCAPIQAATTMMAEWELLPQRLELCGFGGTLTLTLQ